MTLRQKQQRMVAHLRSIRDPQARLAWVIEQARRFPPLPPNLSLDGWRIKGCVARLWIVPLFHEGCCWFQSDSDALSLKALSGLMCELYSGCKPEEVTPEGPAFLEELEFSQYLPENRR